MAKKNKVVIMGFVHEIIDQENMLFTVKIRKNEKRYVYPIVELDEKIKHMASEIKPGMLVAVEGKITTRQMEDKHDCPQCSEKILDKYVFTTITAFSVKLLEAISEDVYLNQVVILGVVCREKDFRYIEGTKSPLGNTKYQVAVNRKEPRQTDYPWIASFARQAEEDARRLQVGSQVLIDGILNTRKNDKECTCAACGTTVQVTEHLTEVVTASVEYLNNCVFDEGEE